MDAALVTRPEWLHVVCLPSGQYVFFLPDPSRRVGSYYVPTRAVRTNEQQRWPHWPVAAPFRRLMRSARRRR